ncbi:MAG TPA: hypothetical protein GXZ46_06030 [Actinomycetales bacterium]|nr:hypothetical protein [Actinomycetales bacterium]
MTTSDPEHTPSARPAGPGGAGPNPFGPTDPNDPSEMTGANVGDTGPTAGATGPGGTRRHPVDRNDGFFGDDIPVEDRPHNEEQKNPRKKNRRPTFLNILAALFSGAVAGFIVWWSLLTDDGQTWMVAIAVAIVIAVAIWRGFEAAIAASIAASATVVGLWAYILAEDDNLWDTVVAIVIVGVGTLLVLIVIGGVTAAIAQGVRAAQRRRAADVR